MNVITWEMGPWKRLAHVARYSTLPIIRKESVAEHSFFVALNSLAIATWLREKSIEVDVAKLLSRALVHDLDEALTGDFIHTFKHHNEEVSRAIHNTTLELMAESGLPTELMDHWHHAKYDDLEGDIVELADMWTVVSYSTSERELGNSVWRLLHQGAINRLLSRDWHPLLRGAVNELLTLCGEAMEEGREEG